jgi:hypothetical protein
MKQYYTIIFLLGLFTILFSCSEGNSNIKKGILYPNEDSELTLLMRDMYNYYDSLKVNIENGNVPSKFRDFSEIHNAVATKPSKSESPLFKAMSTVYVESADRLNSSKSNMPKIFNTMIDNCMNCHQQMCPGPMVKIKKLYLNDLK